MPGLILDDYSAINGLGGAVKGFAQGLIAAQEHDDKEEDRKQKRLEFEAKMKSTQTEEQRKRFSDILDIRGKGLLPPSLPPGGDYTQTDPSKYQWDKESPAYITAKNSGMRGIVAGERLEETRNQNAINAGKQIQDDKILTSLQQARYSLDRGRKLLNGKTPLTYNNLNAVQQDVINGMSQAGQSSEGKVNREMQESWIGRWNNAMAKAGKYGPDNDLRQQDPGLYKQIHDLLEEVDSASASNMRDRVQKLKKNFTYSTNKRLQQTVNDVSSQYDQPPDQAANGLVQPGLVGGGLVSPSPTPVITPEQQRKLDRLQELKLKAAGSTNAANAR